MGAMEIIVIFVIYLLFFGAKGIPSLARTMGKAMRQFQDAKNDIQREILDGTKEIKDDINQIKKNTEDNLS